MKTKRKTSKKNESGFFVIWTVGISLLLLFVSFMVVDFWNVFAERRDLSDLADGAAVAATGQVDPTTFESSGVTILDPSALSVACTYIQNNSTDLHCGPDPATDAQVTWLASSKRICNGIDYGYAGVHVSLPRKIDMLAVRFLPNSHGSVDKSFSFTAQSDSVATPIDPAGLTNNCPAP